MVKFLRKAHTNYFKVEKKLFFFVPSAMIIYEVKFDYLFDIFSMFKINKKHARSKKNQV